MIVLRERLRQAAPVVIALVLFVGAIEILRRELSTYSWATITADLSHTPSWQIAAAVGLTLLNYLVLTGYDFLAFASINRRMAAWRIGLASFVAYAIANNVGFAMLSGTSIRYRFYTRWGLSAEDLSRIVFSYSITFWLGLMALGGLSLALGPLPSRRRLARHVTGGAGGLAAVPDQPGLCSHHGDPSNTHSRVAARVAAARATNRGRPVGGVVG